MIAITLGSLVGLVLALLILIFFDSEVYDFIEQLRKKVRKLCKLSS